LLAAVLLSCGSPDIPKGNNEQNNGAANNGAVDNGADDGGDGASDTGALTELFAADYAQNCMFDGDCALVGEGEQCLCAPCDNAGVRGDVRVQWQADKDALMCPLPDSQIFCMTCPVRLAACGAAGCYAREPIFVGADDFEQGCESDEDCVLIPVGEVCEPCRCDVAGIHKDAVEAYQALVQGVDCVPGPNACDCEAPSVAVCDPMSKTCMPEAVE